VSAVETISQSGMRISCPPLPSPSSSSRPDAQVRTARRITMNASPATPSFAAPPRPFFTLGKALRWLGHDCPDHRCWEPIAATPASVWFIRRGPLFGSPPMESLVLLDPTNTGERIDEIVYEVDCCTRGEAIHVRQRHHGETQHDMIALAWRTVPTRTRLTHPRHRVEDIEQGGELTGVDPWDLRRAVRKPPATADGRSERTPRGEQR
jgi:hypothetical protein